MRGQKKEKKRRDILLVGSDGVTRHHGGGLALTVARDASDIAVVRQRLTRALGHSSWRYAVAAVAHGLGGKIAVVHALGAVLTRRPPVLVHALGLSLAASHTAEGDDMLADERGEERPGGRP